MQSDTPREKAREFTIAIVIAAILSGIVLAITGMLVIMCHVTNKRRRKELRVREGLEMGATSEVEGPKSGDVEVEGRK